MNDVLLTRDKVAALLAEIAESITGKGKPNAHNTHIVLVQYGYYDDITHVSVHLFDEEAGRDSAKEYCEKINNVIFSGSGWIHANIIHENAIEKLEKPFQVEMIRGLDDRAVQYVINRIDKYTLAVALYNIDSGILWKIKKNMTKRAVKMLEDDMKQMPNVAISYSMEAQKIILDLFYEAEKCGEIVIPGITGEDE